MRPTLAPAAGRGILLVRLPLLLLLGAAVPVQAAALRSSLRGKGSSGSTPLTPLGNGRAGDGVSALESDNPLLATGDMPNFAAVRPEHAKPAVEARLAEGVQMLERIEATLAAKLKASEEPVPYEALVLPLEELDSHVGRPWEMLGLLKSVRESPELRTEMAALEPKVVAFWQNVSQSKPVYEALARLNASAGFGALSEARRRIVQRELVGRRLSGMGLAGPQEEEFNSVQQRLHDLSTTFADHVLDARRSWNLTLYTNESVRGIPSRALAAAAAAAQRGGLGNATAAHGPWLLSLEASVLGPVLTYAEDQALRERLFRAHSSLASTGPANNTVVLAEILALRQREAELLGFGSYAAVSFATKMATEQEVHQLLAELQAAGRPAAEKEEVELRDFAKSAGAPGNASELQLWDRGFYAERLRQERYGVNAEELRAYFALPTVLQGLFALAERLFGVKATPMGAEAEPALWQQDVWPYRLSLGEATVGHVLVDPYSRPQEKRAGAWMHPVISRRRLGGTVQLPVAAVVTNFPPAPGPGKPSLLSLGEVETLFHEFGHALQHVLTVQNETSVSGINGVEWDAVEIASQFMEYWVDFDRATFYSFARHHQTGEPLPEETYQRLRDAHGFRAGTALLGQIYLGRVDLRLHEQFEPGQDTNAIEKAVARDVLVAPTLPESRPLCSFSHIFSGGYAAGYYSYQWSKVLSADAFGAFADAGSHDSEVALGRRFASTLLALGGGRAPAQVFADFRGRAPTPAALLRYSGLAPAATAPMQ